MNEDTRAAELDNPVWEALRSRHHAFAVVYGRAARYGRRVSGFASIDDSSSEAFSDLLEIVNEGETVGLFTAQALHVPAIWKVLRERPIDQMILKNTVEVPPNGLKVRQLVERDVPEMMALAHATEPGPFFADTNKMGSYIGIRATDGELLAMAGERLSLPGSTEISAVCTAHSHRGKGYAKHLVSTLCRSITMSGRTPFLHVKSENGAKALYEKIGFAVRKPIMLTVLTHDVSR